MNELEEGPEEDETDIRSVRRLLSSIHSECNAASAKTAIETINNEVLVTIR
jgi:hypothetical protein